MLLRNLKKLSDYRCLSNLELLLKFFENPTRVTKQHRENLTSWSAVAYKVLLIAHTECMYCLQNLSSILPFTYTLWTYIIAYKLKRELNKIHIKDVSSIIWLFGPPHCLSSHFTTYRPARCMGTCRMVPIPPYFGIWHAISKTSRVFNKSVNRGRKIICYWQNINKECP